MFLLGTESVTHKFDQGSLNIAANEMVDIGILMFAFQDLAAAATESCDTISWSVPTVKM